jgi:hypothetical protein
LGIALKIYDLAAGRVIFLTFDLCAEGLPYRLQGKVSRLV